MWRQILAEEEEDVEQVEKTGSGRYKKVENTRTKRFKKKNMEDK